MASSAANSLSPELQGIKHTTNWTCAIVVATTGVLLLVIPVGPWALRLICVPALATATWFTYHWDERQRTLLIACALTLCAATAAACSLFGGGLGGEFALAACGAVVVTQLPRHRLEWSALLYVAATAIATLLALTHPDLFTLQVLLAAGFVLVYVATFLQCHRSWQRSIDADAGRRAERDLAVARERFRFAADLHDIQGHTLHVVKLKAALAARLVRIDPDRAEDELHQIRDLISTTIAQTRELAYAERRLTLAGELANAENLLRAAGADVVVTHDSAPPAALEESACLVLREATTNILRHSQATWVRIRVAARAIEITNDGCQPGTQPAFSGLAVLAERLATADGTLTARQVGDTFHTAATFVDGAGAAGVAATAGVATTERS